MPTFNIRAKMIYRMRVQAPNSGPVNTWGHNDATDTPTIISDIPCWAWIASDRRDFVRYDPQAIRAITAYIIVIPLEYGDDPYNVTSDFEILDIKDRRDNLIYPSMKVESFDRSHNHIRLRAAKYDA